MVASILELKIPSDSLDYKKVKEFIKSVNASLGIDGKEVTYKDRTLSKCYQEDYCDEEEPGTPFARLPDEYLESAIKGFRANFHPWLLKILLEFKPYQDLLKYARTNNLIEGNFGNYQAQTPKHKNAIKEDKISKNPDWYKQEISDHESAISHKKENQWAFKAIFQKAIVRLGRLVEFEFKNDPNLGNIDNVLFFLNDLYEKNVLKVDAKLEINGRQDSFPLWTFIALNQSNQKIKVNNAVENRILSILKLWYFASRKIEIDRKSGNNILSKRKMLQFFSAETHKIQWSGCSDDYKLIENCFETAAFYGKGHEELSSEQKKEMVKERFSNVLWTGLPLSTNQNNIDEESEDI